MASPGDTLREIAGKVREWFAGGAAMVWVVNPALRIVTVYRSPVDFTTLTDREELLGGEVVAGFRCRVRDLFVSA